MNSSLWIPIFVIITALCDDNNAQYYYQTPANQITGYPQVQGYGSNYYYSNGIYYRQPAVQRYQYALQAPVSVTSPSTYSISYATRRQKDEQLNQLLQSGRVTAESLRRSLVAQTQNPRALSGSRRQQRRKQVNHRDALKSKRKVRSKKRRRKSKTLFSVYDGFHIQGGTALRGKFGASSGCKRACANLGYCMAADYERTNQKCYIHTSATSCDGMTTSKASVHYQRAPCESVERDEGAAIFPGKYVSGGVEAFGIDNLQDCIKSCTERGGGIAVTCFGINYDYANQKCYIHAVRSRVCPVPDKSMLLDKPNAIHMVYCS